MVKQQRNPLMDASRHYDQGYHGEVHANLIGNEAYFKAVGEASKSLYLRSEERRLRVLDYGCGLGQLIDGLEHGAGFEVSEEARIHCLRRGLRVWGRLEEVPAGEWDLVIARHVLEHLESPLDALRGMQSLLAPGGTLILVLPREGHVAASLTPDVNQHLFCWNFRSVNNLLARAGYRPEVNEYRYVRGFGVLLPIHKLGWPRLYLHAVQLAGRLVGNAELYIRARP
jgi:SAM-dependent methyltransferase